MAGKSDPEAPPARTGSRSGRAGRSGRAVARPGAASSGLESLAERAAAGDRGALEELVGAIQDDVYGLALRMLWHPEDAEDATQEILVRLVTRLDSFRGESSFRTWAYRVAANHLLTTRARRMERPTISFEEFARDLDEGLSDDPPPGADAEERRLLIEEVKIGCSQAMLLCLDRAHRLAYLLGEILELPGPEAARVLGIGEAAFRKRLQRARAALHAFLRAKCGLVDPGNSCRCRRRVRRAMELGRVERGRFLFADHPMRRSDDVTARRGMLEVERIRAEADVLRTNPAYASPRDFAARIRALLGERNA